MADDNPTPMTDSDASTPPATTEFQPAAPLKDAGVEFDPAEGGTLDQNAGTTDTRQAIKDGAAKLQTQAGDRVRQFASDGQARAGTALGQLAQMLTDAAGQVDDKLGPQYGDYARTAATNVQGFADTVQNKDLDELFEDARAFVRRSPGVAIGAAATIGFVIARLVQSGLEADRNRDEA